jgi:hypothetical protein
MAELITILTKNDPQVMRIHAELAAEIGLNESIALLQLEFLVRKHQNERDGKLWAYASLEELRDRYFKWWSLATISRVLKRLEDADLIFIGNYNATSYDRTQWFAMNPAGLGRLEAIKIDVSILQNEKSNMTDCKIDPINLQNRSLQNETTIPKTTKEKPKTTTTPTKKSDTPQPPVAPDGAGAPGGGGRSKEWTDAQRQLMAYGVRTQGALQRHRATPIDRIHHCWQDCQDRPAAKRPGALIALLDSPIWTADDLPPAAPPVSDTARRQHEIAMEELARNLARADADRAARRARAAQQPIGGRV